MGGDVTMTVEERKKFDKHQKEHLRQMILLYQKDREYTAETLEGKTLKQLESICTRKGI